MGVKIRKLLVLIGGLILVGVILFLQFAAPFKPQIISVQPANNASDVSPKSQIEILFEKEVPEQEQSNFYVRLVPGVATTNVWVSPKLLRLVPQTELASSTNYSVSVLFNEEEIYTSNFATVVLATYTEEEISEIRQMALEVSAAFYQTVEQYPFIQKLPIRKDSYTIVFDYDREEFRVRLKMPSTAPEATKQEALNAALADMQASEITVDDYGYYVLYSE